MGMSDETITRRQQLLKLATDLQTASIRTDWKIADFVDGLRGEGVVWMVVDKPDDWLIPQLEYLSAKGQADEVQRFGQLRVYRLK